MTCDDRSYLFISWFEAIVVVGVGENSSIKPLGAEDGEAADGNALGVEMPGTPSRSGSRVLLGAEWTSMDINGHLG